MRLVTAMVSFVLAALSNGQAAKIVLALVLLVCSGIAGAISGLAWREITEELNAVLASRGRSLARVAAPLRLHRKLSTTLRHMPA
jgi:hypothetical protein